MKTIRLIPKFLAAALTVAGGLAVSPQAGAALNDNFDTAWVITSVPYSTNSSNAEATRETGEPEHHGSTIGHTVWWRWTAPGAGPVQLNTTNSSFRAVLGVYTGAGVSSLTKVVSGRGNHLLNFNAAAGTTYWIALDCLDAGAWGNFTFRMVPGEPPPANDLFANATVINGPEFTVTGVSNSGATSEPGEPRHADISGNKSLWWTWTAPASGPVRLDTAGSSVNTLLAVYTGSAVADLSLVAANDDDAPSMSSKVNFQANANTTYSFAVDGWEGREGQITLNLVSQAPVGLINDNFANATLVTASNFTVTNQTNLGATKEAGEPDHNGNAGGASVWWAWTAPFTGLALVDLTTTEFWALVGIYTGSTVSNLVRVGSTEGNHTFVPFQAVSGTVYRVAVDGYGGSGGKFDLHFSPGPPPPPNDQFTHALVIPSMPYTTNVVTLAATKEPGEPNHHGSDSPRTGGQSVWWTWTAPFTGRAQVDTKGSTIGTVVGVYLGTSVNSLTTVANGFGANNVIFTATTGETCRIAVDSSHDVGGEVTFNFHTAPPPPANDLWERAAPLTGSSMTVSNAANVGASKEVGEPDHAGVPGGKSIWWRWTAPASGLTQIDTIGSDFDTLLAVYTGSSVSALTQITSDDQGGGGNASKTNFNAVAGVTYYIAADGFLGQEGNIVLHLMASAEGTIACQSPTLILSNGQHYLQFQITGPANSTVILQIKTDLNQPDWTPIRTNVLTGGAWLFTDPDPAVEPQRFYRVLQR